MPPVSKHDLCETISEDKSLSQGHAQVRKDTTGMVQFDKYEEKNIYEDGQILKKIFDVTIEENLYKTVDASKKVVEFVPPNELQKILPLTIGKEGCKSVSEIEEIIDLIVKYSVKTSHPHFHNQLYGGVDEVALTAAWLMECLNTNQYTFEVAPVFVMFEHYLIKKLSTMFGWMDSEGDGLFSPGGSTSNMYGIACARHVKYPRLKETGMFGHKELVLFTSDMSHYSITKAASWMGFGSKQVVKVATDKYGKMIPESLKKAITEVRSDGKEPFFVNATAGTTVYGAFDPLEEIAQVCIAENLWMHVDACWGGGVVVSEKYKHLLKGIERADSIAWNPHKMLCASLQCSTILVKQKGLLAACNRLGASYLFQPDKYYDITYDLGDKSIQCGRKADAVKLWIMFKIHGLEKMGARVDAAYEAARYLEEQIKVREGFRLVLDKKECTNVCFWYIPPSLRNKEQNEEWWQAMSKIPPTIKGRMAKAGTLLMGYQPVEVKNQVNFFRMVVTGYPIATKEHMDHVLDEIERSSVDL